MNTTARKYGTSLIYWQADVTDPEALQAIFDEAIAICRYPLRGVVAAAGIMVMEDAINYPLATFKRVMTVNVDGCFLTSQAAARAFAQQGITGSIVLVSSMSGTVANRVSVPAAYLWEEERVADFLDRVFTLRHIISQSQRFCRWLALWLLNGAQGRIIPQSGSIR